jgi:hypothetical protein
MVFERVAARSVRVEPVPSPALDVKPGSPTRASALRR